MITSESDSEYISNDNFEGNSYHENYFQETNLYSRISCMENRLLNLEYETNYFKNFIKCTLAKGEETRNENSSITKSLIMIDEMDITKLSAIEINLIKKISNKIDCLEKNKPKPHPVQFGKYKYLVSELNNMKLTYEKILTEAALCSKRFDKRYSVHELTDESQIGVFARQTLSEEIRNILRSIYPNSKWTLISNYKLGSDLAWKCTIPDCDFRLKLKFNYMHPYLVFKSNCISHSKH